MIRTMDDYNRNRRDSLKLLQNQHDALTSEMDATLSADLSQVEDLKSMYKNVKKLGTEYSNVSNSLSKKLNRYVLVIEII